MPWTTIKAPINVEIEKIKGSRFIGYLAPVDDVAGCEAFVEEVQALHPEARHWCWAYRVGERGQVTRYSDDGEPSGSAGRPILQHLEGADVTDVVAVIVRYFGGTKLGVGGLARAYGAATRAALDAAERAFVEEKVSLVIDMAYNHEPHLRAILERYEAELIDAAWAARVTLTCTVLARQIAALEAEIQEATSARAIVRRIE